MEKKMILRIKSDNTQSINFQECKPLEIYLNPHRVHHVERNVIDQLHIFTFDYDKPDFGNALPFKVKYPIQFVVYMIDNDYIASVDAIMFVDERDVGKTCYASYLTDNMLLFHVILTDEEKNKLSQLL